MYQNCVFCGGLFESIYRVLDDNDEICWPCLVVMRKFIEPAVVTIKRENSEYFDIYVWYGVNKIIFMVKHNNEDSVNLIRQFHTYLGFGNSDSVDTEEFNIKKISKDIDIFSLKPNTIPSGFQYYETICEYKITYRAPSLIHLSAKKMR